MDKFFKLQTYLVLILIGIIICITLSKPVSAMDVTHSYVLSANKKMDRHSFYWVVALVGGSIGITLVYVGWKKYKAEVNKKVKKDANS